MNARERSNGGWHHHLWLAILVVATLVFTGVFACAAPFAALGAVAALTLSRRDALLVTAEVWLINQLTGFLVLGYPWTANSAAWGVTIAAAAILGTLAAGWTAERVAVMPNAAKAVVALTAAFAIYEVVIAVGAAGLGGTQNLAPAIVAQVLGINAGALVVLSGLVWLGGAVGLRGLAAAGSATAR